MTTFFHLRALKVVISSMIQSPIAFSGPGKACHGKVHDDEDEP